MVRLGKIASSVASGAKRFSPASLTRLSPKSLVKFSPSSLSKLSPTSLSKLRKVSSSSFKVAGGTLTTAGKKVSKVAGNLGSSASKTAGKMASSASKTAGKMASSASDAAGSATKSIKKTASSGMESLTKGAKRQARNAGGWIYESSKTGMQRMGKMCRDNPVKCTAAMALAGYTASNFVENSRAQQGCIAKCLPSNWPAVVDGDGAVEPNYFDEDPKPHVPGDNKDEAQPQCTAGTDCEPYCKAACKEEHPTTLLGAALEGAEEIMDDAIVPFVEDVIGLPITDIGGGVMWIIRIVAVVVAVIIVRRVYRFMGFGKQRGAKINVSVASPMQASVARPIASATPPLPVARPIASATPLVPVAQPIASATPTLPVAVPRLPDVTASPSLPVATATPPLPVARPLETLPAVTPTLPNATPT